MKKRTKRLCLPALLLAVLLLCACAGQTPSAAPKSGDGPESISAGGAADSAQTLDDLWEQLEGKWILAGEKGETDGGFLCPVYEFCSGRTPEGGRCLMRYSAYGSGAEKWIFESAAGANGVYTMTAVEESGETYICDCRAGGGLCFTLQLDGETLLVGAARPASVALAGEAEGPAVPFTFRAATPEETQQLAFADAAEGRLLLEDGSILRAGLELEPVRYRRVTQEELDQLVQDAYGEAFQPLTDSEITALWENLSGMWVMENKEEYPPYWNDAFPLQRLAHFENRGDGPFTLETGLPETEPVAYVISSVSGNGSVYILEAAEQWRMMLHDEYEPGVADLFTLTLEESGGITLSACAPAKYGAELDLSDEIGGWHWRFASTEEAQRAAREGTGGVLVLENGDMIAEGYAHGPVRYRLETPEEEKQRMGG